MHWMDDDLNDRRRRGLYRVRRRLQSAQGPRVRLHGREFVNFSSNDYLDLAADPRLARAAARAARRYGCGAGASPLVSGLSAAAARPGTRPGALGGDRGRPGFQQRFRRQPRRWSARWPARRRRLQRRPEPRQPDRRLPSVPGRASTSIATATGSPGRPAAPRGARRPTAADRQRLACSAWTAIWRRWRGCWSWRSGTTPCSCSTRPMRPACWANTAAG